MKLTESEKKRRIEAEKRERFALSNVLNIMRAKRPDLEYVACVSPIVSFLEYDCILFVKENDQVIARYIIEIKNRSESWNEFIYEQKKHNALLKKQKDLMMELNEHAPIIYICTTPEKTYIFDIENITLNKAKKQKVTKVSYADVKVEGNKNVYLLKKEDAIKMNYSYDEQKYLQSLEEAKITSHNVFEKKKTYTASIF